MLLAERTGAEWEILEGNEWEEEEGQAESPVHHTGNMGRVPMIEETGVLVPAQAEARIQYIENGNRMPRIEETGVLVPEQGVTIGTGGAEQGGDVDRQKAVEKEKSKSGWMKLKSR